MKMAAYPYFIPPGIEKPLTRAATPGIISQLYIASYLWANTLMTVYRELWIS